MMKKKAQGISLNVIIIAAIGLVVLVLLVAITTGRMTIFGKSVGQTTDVAKINICKKSSDYICASDTANLGIIELQSPPQGGWSDCNNNCYKLGE